jgi:2-isopropylmalate synthase
MIARQLALLGVDVIEAGYPASSPEDAEAVRLIAEEIQGPAICGLSRAVPSDIDACGKVFAKARRPRIHTGIGASDIHITGKFQDERYGRTLAEKKVTILQMAADAVKRARQYADDVEFYAEDAGRSDPAYLFEMLEAVIDAGATVVNIPDTTGYTVPEQYGCLIRGIRENVPNIARATISVHCHDDLGMAVSNTLYGVLHGARQVEGTINGIGERAGNAALEEIIMALATRADYFPFHTRIDTRELQRTSRLVADLLGLKVPPNKAVVGGNAFAHSSGIHVDGFLKERLTYEIMRPEDVGIEKSRVVLTARTGRHGLRDEIHPAGEIYQLEYLHIYSGTTAIPTATVRVRCHTETREGASIGDGPVDAVSKALSSVTGTAARLVRYEIQGVTGGTEALGEVTIQLEEHGLRVVGRGASTDIVEASARAYIDGLNKLAALQARSAASA